MANKQEFRNVNPYPYKKNTQMENKYTDRQPETLKIRTKYHAQTLKYKANLVFYLSKYRAVTKNQ